MALEASLPAQVSTRAPEFHLASTPDQKVALSDFLGRPVVLVFYPADWSPVCSDQLSLYTELHEEFANFDAEVMGISVDGIWSHLAFAHDRKYHLPLLSDFEPKGATAKAYGVYRDADGFSERALFVIDREGIISLDLRINSVKFGLSQPDSCSNSGNTRQPQKMQGFREI